MPIIDYCMTPANRHDADALVPLLLSMEANKTISKVGDFYGDNAYFTAKNKRWLSFYEKQCKFHSKEETGKVPKDPCSAKRKSHIRSKVESTFGILNKNHNFGRTEVRNIKNVRIDTCLIFTSWNYFFLLSYLIDRFEDHISLRKSFFEN